MHDSYVSGTDVERYSLAPGCYTLNWVPEGKTYNITNNNPELLLF